ncbi:hypothetical protein B4U79_11978 [Dinothrombium tinctorium]|uniref:Phospholipid scramblase n=1 Tax=Dinothrombium tinctorium TaxID=1965070 RepID=A0A3S3P520_9ACAR|nr:hypothetical protein B4U79_11978 [Dinothrombium tinctorium]
MNEEKPKIATIQPSVVIHQPATLTMGINYPPQDEQNANGIGFVIPMQNIGCKPLEILNGLSTVYVRQPISIMKLLGCQPNNEYMIYDDRMQQILFAKEKSNWCNRNCCGAGRRFHMKVFDNTRSEVFKSKLHSAKSLHTQAQVFELNFGTLI